VILFYKKGLDVKKRALFKVLMDVRKLREFDFYGRSGSVIFSGILDAEKRTRKEEDDWFDLNEGTFEPLRIRNLI